MFFAIVCAIILLIIPFIDESTIKLDIYTAAAKILGSVCLPALYRLILYLLIAVVCIISPAFLIPRLIRAWRCPNEPSSHYPPGKQTLDDDVSIGTTFVVNKLSMQDLEEVRKTHTQKAMRELFLSSGNQYTLDK